MPSEGGKTMLLGGKTAIISGAATPRGIGLATARLFAQHGARVAILDVNPAAIEMAVSSLGPGHVGVVCDVTDKAACESAVAEVISQFGHLNILINNAGITQPFRVMEIDQSNWQRVIDVNLSGVMFLSQAVIPHMRQRNSGSIACMSSVAALQGGGVFGGSHYAAAKAGVLGLAKAMARELGPDNIRVNCVTPGLIGTDITSGKMTEEREAEIINGIPLGRVGTAEEVAGIYLFLASDLSSYTTGAVIDVNGGMLIH